MALFLRVAVPVIYEFLQKLVNFLVDHLSLQLMAFFSYLKFGLSQLFILIILNVVKVLILSLHLQHHHWKTSISFWKCGDIVCPT